MHLEDAASPTLDERSKHIVKPTSLRTSDKHSLIRYLGLPLNIFGKVCPPSALLEFPRSER